MKFMLIIVFPFARLVWNNIHLLVSQVRRIFVYLLLALSWKFFVRHVIEIVLMPTHFQLDSFTIFLFRNLFDLILELYNIKHALKLQLECFLECILWFWKFLFQKHIDCHHFLLGWLDFCFCFLWSILFRVSYFIALYVFIFIHECNFFHRRCWIALLWITFTADNFVASLIVLIAIQSSHANPIGGCLLLWNFQDWGAKLFRFPRNTRTHAQSVPMLRWRGSFTLLFEVIHQLHIWFSLALFCRWTQGEFAVGNWTFIFRITIGRWNIISVLNT